MLSELAFEQLRGAIETARGTAAVQPSHLLRMAGTIVPNQDEYAPDESSGTLEARLRSIITRQWSEWSTETSPFSYNMAPFIFNMAFGTVTAPVLAAPSTLAQDWTFIPNITADDLATATLFWGDSWGNPTAVSATVYQAAYATIESLTFNADRSGSDGVTWTMSGRTNPQTSIATPTAAVTQPQLSSLLIPNNMRVWLDTGTAAIATTDITNRVVSVEHQWDNNLSYKFSATDGGPGASLGYGRIGRGKRNLKTTIRIEFRDATEYNLMFAHSSVKLRTKFFGPLIETVTATSYYNHLEVDNYGVFNAPAWSDLEGTNRVLDLELDSEAVSVLGGASWRVQVRNQRAVI
jgi:hypothetical protein